MDADSSIKMVKRIGDLEDRLLELVIDKLTATEQVAVTRVCKRFDSLALKITTVLDFRKVPREKILPLVCKMPKLDSIISLKAGHSRTQEKRIIKEIASINKNIFHFSGWHGMAEVYVTAIKESGEVYNGSKLTTVFYHDDYKELMRKYPDLEIRCHFHVQHNGRYIDDHNTNGAIAGLDIRSTDASKICYILNKTVNVTHLSIVIEPDEKSFRLHHVLDSISKLQLLRLLYLDLELFKFRRQYDSNGKRIKILDEDKMYKLTETDFNSLREVLSIKSLRTVSLYLNCHPDHQNVYNCFMASTNNNFKSFTMEFLSQFIRSARSHCYPARSNRAKSTAYHEHKIETSSLNNFAISDFIKKFKKNTGRFFTVQCKDDNDWNQIKQSCEQFIKSNHDYRFTLGRLSGDLSIDEPIDVTDYNL